VNLSALLPPFLRVSVALWLFAFCQFAPGAETFRIGTYNLDNYLDHAVGTRPAKSAASKAKIRQSLLALKADVLALQEMGSTNALLELRDSLKSEGLFYPHWEHATGYDTNIQVAILSRFPVVARRHHTNESFLLYGRRFHVSRAFAEADIRINASYAFTLITAHLKSRREVAQGDQAEIREQEAIALREIIDARLKIDPEINLVVLGDFNDVKDSASTRTLLGRGRTALTDTRPAERNGDDQPHENRRFDPPHITWTHYYGKEDTYSRVDYILLSPGMAREWNPAETYVLGVANWAIGSDHRPIVAGILAENR
jgi:endonuclease/exonuclease/phosphatase family metal-dependent hydrolase